MPPTLQISPQIPPLPVLGWLEGRGHLIFTKLPHGQSTESLVRPAHKCTQTHTRFQPTISIMGLAPDSLDARKYMERIHLALATG